VVLHRHADDPAQEIGLPALAVRFAFLFRGELVPPAELLQQHESNSGYRMVMPAALRMRAVGSEERDAVSLDAEGGRKLPPPSMTFFDVS